MGTHNYDHPVANQNRLLGMFHEHEDDMYRLASNPGGDGTHRAAHGSGYASPNRVVPANGYTCITEAASFNLGYTH